MKKLLALLLALYLGLTPVLAEEVGTSALGEETPEEAQVVYTTIDNTQTPSVWTVPYLADAYALKLVDDDYGTYIKDPVTLEQLDAIAGRVAAKVALLEPAAGESVTAAGTTRGDVADALVRAYGGSGVEGLQDLGVLQGDGVSLALERECTYEEAMVMATRLVLAVYDRADAGSKGLLWKAVNGDNTLYLLGTAHLDRGNVYPFHKTLRQAITDSETVILELDLNDQAGMMEYAAMQVYSDGTTLKDHVPQELYDRTVAVYAAMGMEEDLVNACKPWALALGLTSAIASDTAATETPMAIDLYVNAAAANAGIPVVGAETYAFQGGIFDGLSPEYQEEYLASGVAMVEAALNGEETDQESQDALDEVNAVFDNLVDVWKAGDLEGFQASYDKEAIVNSDDEINAKLFTQRDPGMVEVAVSYLELEGSHTSLMAVGAGHMVAPGGIVPELEALGYTVTQVK